MSHSILTYGADRDERVPPFLQGAITPEPVGCYEDVTSETLHPFWSKTQNRYVFRNRLFFVSRETRIDLDFYPVLDGFLGSAEFVEVVSSITPGALTLTEVEMVDESGRPNAGKAMTFCQAAHAEGVCDLSRMDIDGRHHESIDGPNRIDHIVGHSRIVAATGVVLRAGLPDLFATREIPRFSILVSDGLRDACSGRDVVGAWFVPVADIVVVDFMSGGAGRYSKADPHWRARSDLRRWTPPVRRDELFDPGSAGARKMLEELLGKKL